MAPAETTPPAPPGPSPAFVELVGLARAYRRSRALSVAAELGVADLLGAGPLGVDELARATATHAGALYRLLRALASVGVFHEGEGRTFALTEMGELLRSDHPLTVRPLARLLGADYEWAAWGGLLHAVRTGQNAADRVLGMDVWEHWRGDPAAGAVFDAAMRTFAAADAAALLAAHDFGRYAVVADVGGGTGALLAGLLAGLPSARGVLFDRESVVAGAGPVLAAAGVAERVDVVAGDFFASVPGGADAYVLRRILHDWPDEDAVRLLGSVRAAMTGESHLLVVDAVVGPPNGDPLVAFLDLGMLVVEGGRERTATEWEQLLAAAGLRIRSVRPVTATSHVIDAVAEAA